MPALLALTAAAVFGAADFVGGYATRRTAVMTVTLISNLVGVIIAVGLVTALGGTWTPANIGWGAVGGACGLGGLVLLYLGLASGPNRLVSPLSAVLAASIPVLVGLATGDGLDQRVAVGLLLTPVAIWLVAGGDHRLEAGARRTLALAVGAGVGFGLFFTCLAQTSDDAGAVPLLAARVASTALLLLASLRHRPDRLRGNAIALPALAGTLDMTANGLFLWSSIDGQLSVVGALVNLFPVTTILLALIVLHERLSRSQAIGLTLAIGSAALLS